MSNELASLRNEVKTLKKQKEDAETMQVELEKEVEKLQKVIQANEKASFDLEEKLKETQQRLVNTQQEKAMAFGLDPAQLALLVLQAIPLTRDANGNPVSPKAAEEHVRLVSERAIPVALKIVRSTLDQLAAAQ